VITGVSGDDLDFPGYSEGRDVVTGELKWRWYVVPQNMGEATKVVAIGGMKDGKFVSDQLLVKCPSKYESEKKS